MMKNNISKNDVLSISLNDVFGLLESSENGLSHLQAKARLAQYGLNSVKKNKIGAITVLLRQLKSSLIYLLAFASLISYWIKDYSDGTVILVILFINVSLGFFQEYRAEKTIQKLSGFITADVRVKRDGRLVLIDSSQIVPGDMITLTGGDIVPADVRLFYAQSLQIDESQLTGESSPVYKKISSGDKTGEQELAFSGSVVEKGYGTGVVYATGGNTQFGGIARLALKTKKETQYQKSLLKFGAFLIRSVLLMLILVFISKLIISRGFSNLSELSLFVIALAVATVPEALPVIATVSLSNGALKLAKSHVVVKRLSSIEDLGNVNLLCTDKTGTITENKMTVKNIVSDDESLFKKIAYASIAPVKSRKGKTENSYDSAFLNYLSKEEKQGAKSLIIVKEMPFDPDLRRRGVVLLDAKNKKYYLAVLGAPEKLLEISSFGKKEHYLKNIEKEGSEGLHHLALSYKEIAADDIKDDFDIAKNETNLTFLGYASFFDPLRPTAKNAIWRAEQLGIKVKILTGDKKEVAGYVGSQVGLVLEGDRVYLGEELDKMTADEFKKTVLKYNIFARVSPSQKYHIIEALKENNVVAYQGDGINDAPALKMADVAIAVNTAADVAKESSDIILLNKSLDVIINGIKYGRSIFVNINKYIKYTMSNNFGVLVGSSVLYLFSSFLPVLPLQMLLNNLVGDVPLILVSLDRVENDETVEPEKHNVKDLMFISLLLGIPTAIFEILYFMMVRFQAVAMAQTSLYVFFTFQALVIFYSIRSRKHFWLVQPPPFSLNTAFALAFVFSLAIIYIPIFQLWFSFAKLPLKSLATIFALMAAYFFVADIIKSWYYKK